ncbi:MAG: DUF6702 family protein [Winogradskyella sp.]|uniref:hypothetical protein n=1 Tax=Winogradskyella sp. TaxID=1883156 RepID=UPI003859DBFC
MIKVLSIFAFMFLSVCYGFAHDANKAFFTIQQKEDYVEVQAEFPWSIRNAVLEAYPELENSKDKAEFEAAFYQYVNANFRIAHGDSSLELISVKEEFYEGHSHQNNFSFQFKGGTFDRVSNTLMFNSYDNQKNYNDVILKSESLEFITTPDKASFIVKVSSNNDLEYKKTIIFGAIAFSVFILLIWFRNKKSKHI